MHKRPTHIVLTAIVAIFALVSCGNNAQQQVIVDPLSEAAARVVSAPTTEAVIAETQHTLDSLQTASPDSVRPAVQKICRALLNADRQHDAVAVVGMVYGLDLSQNPEIGSRILTSTLIVGQVRPRTPEVLNTSQGEKYVIVLFHESACRTCQGMIWDLKQRYTDLKKAGVRIVTISTDRDEKVWAEYARGLPWADKLCDYEGFNSPALIAWGVPATPTMFLMDRNKKIIDQYMSAEDIFAVVLGAVK